MSTEPDYDDYYDDDPNDCYECGGEGFVSNCVEEWACLDPEYGCDYCTRPCPLCHPPKRNPELDAVLSEALAATQGIEASGEDANAASSRSDESPVGEADAPNPGANKAPEIVG